MMPSMMGALLVLAALGTPVEHPMMELLPGVADAEHEVEISAEPVSRPAIGDFEADCRARTPPEVAGRCVAVPVAEHDGLRWFAVAGAVREGDEAGVARRHDVALIAIHADVPGATQALWVSIFEGLGSVGPVELFDSPAGPLLRVTLRYSGTGAGVGDLWFVLSNGIWRQVDVESWLHTLRLPAGHGIWKGIVVDPVTFQARSSVWREGDGNCCPSGGEVTVRLALQARTLVVVEQVYHASDELSTAAPERHGDARP